MLTGGDHTDTRASEEDTTTSGHTAHRAHGNPPATRPPAHASPASRRPP